MEAHNKREFETKIKRNASKKQKRCQETKRKR